MPHTHANNDSYTLPTRTSDGCMHPHGTSPLPSSPPAQRTQSCEADPAAHHQQQQQALLSPPQALSPPPQVRIHQVNFRKKACTHAHKPFTCTYIRSTLDPCLCLSHLISQHTHPYSQEHNKHQPTGGSIPIPYPRHLSLSPRTPPSSLGAPGSVMDDVPEGSPSTHNQGVFCCDLIERMKGRRKGKEHIPCIALRTTCSAPPQAPLLTKQSTHPFLT